MVCDNNNLPALWCEEEFNSVSYLPSSDVSMDVCCDILTLNKQKRTTR